MHPEKIWIVLVILAVVLIGANLLMLAMVRGLRGFKGDVFKNFGDASRPWKKEDEGLRELNQRVRDLKSQQAADEEKE
jgi:predicted Holliday junction resolvase-like endonuclease